MAKNVRISDELYALAQWESMLQDRSIAQQLEHWAKLGIAAAEGVEANTGRVSEVEAAVAMTRKLDALDVLSGKRSPDYFYFIPRWMAQQSKRVFPLKYRS
ncbi:MAG: hypothetical protein QM741_01660 [Rudaea sp.]|uniref:TA system antitoxin ParD family protein n=1 Tax=Rudaea sp. TaxID=2136325 RepID=UPI0039E50D38